MKTPTRRSKIARLPRVIREELNHRISENEEGKKLVKWLNEQPAVKAALEERSDGGPISEQNLSDWRKGGHQDWLERQERREATASLVEEAQELHEDAGDDASPAEWMGILAAAALGRMLRALTVADAFDDPAKRREIVAIARELVQLQHVEHECQNVALKAARWEEEQERRRQEEHREEMKAMEWKIETLPMTTLARMTARNEVRELWLKSCPEKAKAIGRWLDHYWASVDEAVRADRNPPVNGASRIQPDPA